MSFNNSILTEELNVSLFTKIDYLNKLNHGDETIISCPMKNAMQVKPWQKGSACVSRIRGYAFSA